MTALDERHANVAAAVLDADAMYLIGIETGLLMQFYEGRGA